MTTIKQDQKAAARGLLSTMLQSQGLLERLGRGLYVLPGSEPTEHQSLVEACKQVPDGVVCLSSALRFHDLTTQAPFEVWMAIDVKARKPRLTYPPLRIVLSRERHARLELKLAASMGRR